MVIGHPHTSTCHPRAWKTPPETVPESALLVMAETAHPEDTNIRDRRNLHMGDGCLHSNSCVSIEMLIWGTDGTGNIAILLL